MARIGHADRLPSGLPIGALRYFNDDSSAIRLDSALDLTLSRGMTRKAKLFDNLDLGFLPECLIARN